MGEAPSADRHEVAGAAADVSPRAASGIRHLPPVHGNLDVSSIGRVEAQARALVDAGHPRIVLDLRGVRLCDAAAMRGLIQVAHVCDANGGWLRLAAPAGVVAIAFAIVAFGRDVPVYTTVAAAMAGDDTERIKD